MAQRPVKITTARAEQHRAVAALREVIEAHGEPCEVLIFCTARGTSEEMERRIHQAIAVSPVVRQHGEHVIE